MRPKKITFFSIISALLLISLIICLNSTLFAQEPTEKWNNTNEQKIWGLMQVWAAVKYNFVYFDQVPDLDWDATVQAAIPRVLAAQDRDEYYKILGELTALLNDGHTIVFPPTAFSGENDNPPVEFQMIEDKIILVRVGDTEEIQTQNIHAGLELIEVNGILAKKYLYEHVLKYCSTGTKQWGEAFGTYLLLNGPKNTTVKLTLKDREEKTMQVELTRNAMTLEGGPFKHRMFDFPPFIEMKMVKDGIAYFKLSSFQAEQIVADFNKEFDKLDLDTIKGIILDVRFNIGGNSDTAFKIVSRFIEQPVKAAKWKTRKYIPAHISWGRPEEWYEGETWTVEPSPYKKFTGPLVVLVGSSTCSAAEDFLVPLDYSDRALLIGEKTAGSTGNPLRIMLPGGGLLQVCTKRDTYPDGKEFVGFGIEPDIVVHPTLKDIYVSKDSTLEKAEEVIHQWENYKKK